MDKAEFYADCLPVIRAFASGRYAVTLGGSRGRAVADRHSDYDFRLYADGFPKGGQLAACTANLSALIARWKAQGVTIDGLMRRRISDTEAAVGRWIAGKTEPQPIFWTVWGYYLPTDILHQEIVEDFHGVAREWKERLRVYPETLRRALLEKHLKRLRHWKDDYHYRGKLAREDMVFLSSLSASLVHDIIQVLFALNRAYYSGDGYNLLYAEGFARKPEDISTRVRQILYPEPPNAMHSQYGLLQALIADTLALAESE